MGEVGQHGEAVRGADIAFRPDDHVAVAVPVRGGAEIGRVVRIHDIHQLMRPDRVRVGVAAAEIGQGRAVHHRALGCAETAFQDRRGIGPGDRVHGVEAHGESAGEHRRDGVEVEEILHQRGIGGDRVDDLDHHVAQMRLALGRKVDPGLVGDAVEVDLLRAGVDFLGHALGRGAAVGAVVLEPEVLVRAAGVVRCRQDQPAVGLPLADQVRGGGRREQTAAPDDGARRAVGGHHPQDRDDGGVVEVAPVAAHHEGLAVDPADPVEDRLHVVLEIAGLHEDPCLLAQAAGAGFLALDGRRPDLSHPASPPPVPPAPARSCRRSLAYP